MIKGLKYISWCDSSGYAVAAKSYLRALSAAGVALNWLPMVPARKGYKPFAGPRWSCAELDAIFRDEIGHDAVLIHAIPDYFPEWLAHEWRPGVRVFGYTVWELERLPQHWPAILNRLDGVLVPCSWNASVFRNAGVTVPIHVVPHLSQFDGLPACTGHDHARLAKRLGGALQTGARFIFYTIAFWSNRKAPYLALEAYLRAFTSKDPVLMILKTSRHDITRWRRNRLNPLRRKHPSPEEAIAAILARHPDPPPLVVIADDALSDGEVQALHALGDCYVSLARTEGWGLGAFEAARYLREIFEHPDESRQRAAPLAGLIDERFSRARITRSFVDALTRGDTT